MAAPENPIKDGIHSGVLGAETIRSSTLYNEDLAPIPASRRSWSTYNYAALWIAMSVNIPTYMLASGMIAGGMSCEAINAMVVALVPSWHDYPAGVWICFAGFWLLHVIVIMRGIRTIKFLQGITAPFLLVIGVALLAWAVVKAGGFGTMLAAP